MPRSSSARYPKYAGSDGGRRAPHTRGRDPPNLTKPPPTTILLYELFDGHRTGMSFAAMGLAVLYFGLAVLSHEFNPEDKRLALSLPGLSVTFLTIALGLILEQRWLTLGWAVEAVVLVWLSFTLKDKFYRAFAAVISVLVLGRLLAMELSLPAAEYRLILNPRVFVFAFSVAC